MAVDASQGLVTATSAPALVQQVQDSGSYPNYFEASSSGTIYFSAYTSALG